MPDTVLPVVLAAGLGSRLGGVPKALLELEGETLLGRTAATLAGHGHERMVVVTGHGADQVEDWWRSAPRPLEARFLHNPRYAELNNFHTLALACEQLPAGRLLALNADIVFHSAVVADALAAGGQLTLAVEQGRVDAEALKVRIDDGHVRELESISTPELPSVSSSACPRWTTPAAPPMRRAPPRRFRRARPRPTTKTSSAASATRSTPG